MTNNEALEKIKVLETEYENIWEKVDYSIIPNGITQEKMVSVLEIMIKFSWTYIGSDGIIHLDFWTME